ncbi:MAG: universal stress protein [Proteobacteria bacterium]|nr:universal stress protein [Pseudomonadota bacterium]
MANRILVAFDESENAMRAVKFIAKSFTPEHEIKLFTVAMDTAAICDLNSPELTPFFLEHQINFCSLEDKKKELVIKAMEEAKGLLVRAGFQEDKITFKTQKKNKGVARDILAEAQTGYDAIVLGRRGLSGIAEFFLGSVSQKVLHGSKNLSVILVN